MANKKVSEMSEIENVESLDNKYVYVVTESEGGNTYNKMSLRALQNSISGGIGIPDWTKLYHIYSPAPNNGDEIFTIDNDSYIIGYDIVPANFAIIIHDIQSPTSTDKFYPPTINTTGIYVKAGTKIIMYSYAPGSSRKQITIVPLVGV